MKVLWICNIMPPAIGDYLHCTSSVKEGWISGILDSMIQEEKIDLCIAYPASEGEKCNKFTAKIGKKKITCYPFEEDTVHPEYYGGEALEKKMKEIIDDADPDVLHLFGTEYGHSLAATRVMKDKSKILVGLQGMVGECAKEYRADLPDHVWGKKTFRDRLKKDSMMQQQKKFFDRAKMEREVIALAGAVTGRTDFDQAASAAIHQDAVYYHMNESLRDVFYEKKEKREYIPHSIFFSQADYPLKGFHYLLDAVRELKEAYPDLSIRVAGNSIISYKTLKDKIKISGYGNYLRKKIKEYGLNEQITFLGRLSAKEMKKEYEKAHVFVCASSVENSPNSMGEAMLAETPVVASRTGGIPSMIEDKKEGLLFTKGNIREMASCIDQIWKDDQLALRLTKEARERALNTHDREKNICRLKEIYEDITKKADKRGKEINSDEGYHDLQLY